VNIGTQFEQELADELGLKRVGGSGSGWSSKLDVRGKETRWSLKATADDGFRLDRKTIQEALQATGGIGGTGETPIWAVRISLGDFIVMRKEDWIRFMTEDSFSIQPSGSEQRRNRAKVPQLLRED
jgi:hypothetical protein